jgi:hypothetical protein
MPMTEDTPRASVGYAQPTPQSGAAVRKFLGLTGSLSSSPSLASSALSSPAVDTQGNKKVGGTRCEWRKEGVWEKVEFTRQSYANCPLSGFPNAQSFQVSCKSISLIFSIL